MLEDSLSNPLLKASGTWFAKHRDGWKKLDASADSHPIITPPELVQQFRGVPLIPPIDCADPQSWIAERIYQMGADDELEACCEVLDSLNDGYWSKELRIRRRPKPLTLKQQALDVLDKFSSGQLVAADKMVSTIRRALEKLND